WFLSVQYFLFQFVVAHAWNLQYSLAHNTISDLGATVCGQFNGRYVCSPQHGLMNLSFVLLGVTMFLGAGLIYHEFKKTKLSAIGFAAMGLAGFGTLIVGLSPENVNGMLHILGAFLPFLIGNIGLG